MPIKRQHEKYLGLPSLVRCGKNHCFAHIKDKMWHKLHDWKEKLLSQPNKEVLIKVVVQAIPNYSMSCFRLSVGLCWEIEGMICSHTVDKRKVYWIHWNWLLNEGEWRDVFLERWQNLMRPCWLKKCGAFTLKGSIYFIWSLAQNVFHMEASSTAKGSYTWHNILHAKEFIKKRLNLAYRRLQYNSHWGGGGQGRGELDTKPR